MKKMLASDIDGTLAFRGKIHKESIRALKELRKQGHALILCTGRDFANTKDLFKDHDIEVDALVLCNGALILDKDFNEEKAVTIESSVVAEIHKYVVEGTEYNVSLIDGYTAFRKERRKSATMGYKVELLDDQGLRSKYDSTKLMSIESNEKNIESAEALKEYVNNKYGEDVIAYRNMHFVDVVPKGCSKAHGIESVLKRFDIEDDEVYVIGDSWNDLSMFEKYKNSYTFTYCEDGLKESANNIVNKFHDCVEHIIGA